MLFSLKCFILITSVVIVNSLPSHVEGENRTKKVFFSNHSRKDFYNKISNSESDSHFKSERSASNILSAEFDASIFKIATKAQSITRPYSADILSPVQHEVLDQFSHEKRSASYSNSSRRSKRQTLGERMRQSLSVRLPSLQELETYLKTIPNFIHNFHIAAMQWPMIGPFYHKFISFFGPDDVQSTFRARSGKLSSDFSEKKYCFGAIGCFTVSRDFYHPVLRPLNIPPMSREKVNANFTLFTRSQAEGVVISPSNLNAIWNTTFNPDRPTKVIIHGWLETPEMQWTEDLASALLKKSDYNVIGVKWNSSWFYVFLLLNTLVVALEVASLLSWLSTNMAVDMGDVHIIGFSLGAQIAGYIGERTPGLGRITGLDPARPQFQGMPPAVRLDPSDALFVDVIHTDTSPDPNEQSVLGTHQLSGHVDFFPNGGADQPGCDFFRPPDFFACSHNVAQKMIVATVSNTCPFLAFPCDSYRSFKAGKCFSCDGPVGCAPMGIDADTWRPMGRKQVAMYLTTTGHPHYCLYHYRFTFHLPKSRHVGNSVRGHLRVTLMKGNARLNTFQITKRALRFIPGTSRSFLLRHEEDYSSVDGMLLSWRAETWPCKVGCGTALTVSHVSFTPLDNISVLMGNSSSVTMCDPHQPSLTVRTGRTAALRASSTCPRS